MINFSHMVANEHTVSSICNNNKKILYKNRTCGAHCAQLKWRSFNIFVLEFLGARAPLPIARDCHSVSQSLSLSSKSFKNSVDWYKWYQPRLSDSVFHKCFSGVSPVFHQWFTRVSPVFHQCFTSVSPVFYQCFHKYFTSVFSSNLYYSDHLAPSRSCCTSRNFFTELGWGLTFGIYL